MEQDVKPKTAMVLGAGLGTRMRPLSDAVPKPLIELSGQTLIDRVLDRLAAAGVERAVVNVHHLADQLERHLAERRAPQIAISDERSELLETGGGVKKALPQLGQGAFFVHNSDSVWLEQDTENLRDMAAAWRLDEMDWLLLVAPRAAATGYDGRGDFTLLEDGRLRRRQAGEEAPLVFAGVSIARADAFAHAPEGAFSLNLLWDQALARGRLYGHELRGIWMHVGTPEALDEAERVLNGGAL